MRLVIAFIALLFLATNSLANNEKEALTAEQIIEKHLTAVGGADALAKLKTRVAVGTVQKENETAAKMAVMSESPNRLSAFYGFEQIDWRLIYNGTKSTYRPTMSGPLSVFITKYEEIIASGFMFNGIALYNTLLDYKSGNIAFKAKGTKKVKDREAYIVEAKPKKGDAVKLYFDAETFMWIRTDFGQARYTKSPGAFTNDVVNRSADDITVEFYFVTSDFRNVDGVLLPFKFEQVITYPLIKQKSSEIIKGTITEYKHNIAIDPTMFK